MSEPVFLLDSPESRDLTNLAEVVSIGSDGIRLRVASDKLGSLPFTPGLRCHYAQVEDRRFRVYRADVRVFDSARRVLFLSPPLLMDERPRRGALRLDLRVPCTVAGLPAETIDISEQGCRVRMSQALVVGNQHELVLKLRDPVTVAVRVVRADVEGASLAFLSKDHRIETLILRMASRRFERASIRMPARIRFDAIEFDAAIENLGPGGARVIAPDEGETGVLRFHLPARGLATAMFTVLRREHGRLGLAFSNISDDDRNAITSLVLFLKRYAASDDGT